MSFHHQERIKRIKQTKALREKGFTVGQLASYFGVKQDTVEEYIREMHQHEVDRGVVAVREKRKVDLFSFSKKSIPVDIFFSDESYSEGFKCKICKHYKKFEGGKKYSEKVYLCIDCFQNLTPEQMGELQ